MEQFQLKEGYSVVLASNSPRRKELLTQMGIPFRVLTKEIEETYPELMPPSEAVRYLSEKKARSVRDLVDDHTIIIASDTLVDLDDVALGKPKDETDAYEMLMSLSGRHHVVHTGVCVILGDQMISSKDTTDVCFKELQIQEVWDYIHTGEPMDKAGAYAIQGVGGKLVSHINGHMDTVIGFPRELVLQLLEELEMP